MLTVKQGEMNELQTVISFYNDLIDALQDKISKPGWEKGVYPTHQFLEDSIKNHTLYIGIMDNNMVGVMIIDHNYAEGYDKIAWQIAADKEEVMVIHALGISPSCQGKGLAKAMISNAIDISKQLGAKTIRLDVLATNIPAAKLYPAMGFHYIDTIKLFYEDVGLTDFYLYEYGLNP